MDYSPHTPSRKADRAAMLREVRELAEKHGAAYTEDSFMGPRKVTWRVTLNGLSAFATVQPQTWGLIHWIVDDHKCLSGAFPADVNPWHRRKATNFPNSWGVLLEMLDAGLAKAKDGSAFLPD